jgi:hypothetical protein
MKIRLMFSGLLIALVALAGCSASGPASDTHNPAPGKSAGRLDACSLLTPADAEALLREAPGEPVGSQIGEGVSRCGYTGRSGDKRVSLVARRASSSAEAARIFRTAQNESKNLSGVEPRPVSGLGDAAFWAGGTLRQLNVVRNDMWLIVASPGSADPRPACEAAARRILLHLE